MKFLIKKVHIRNDYEIGWFLKIYKYNFLKLYIPPIGVKVGNFFLQEMIKHIN